MNIGRVKKLSLQNRFMILVFITVLMVTFVTTFFLYLLVWRNIASLEEKQSTRNIQRLKYLISREASALEDIAIDYAKWDDTYQFAVDSNQEYLDSNMVDETFDNYSWRLAAIFNNNGNLLFSKEYDLESSQEVSLSDIDRNSILELKKKLIDNRSDNGFVRFKDSPLLVSIQPILTSEKEGPVRGYLLLARDFQSAVAYNLSNSLQFDVKIIEVLEFSDSQEKLFSKIKASKEKYIIENSTNDSKAGYLMLDDLDGQPIAIVHITVPDQLLSKTTLAIIYYLLVCGTICLVAGVMVYVFVNRLILKRLKELNNFIEVSKADSTHSARLTVKGNDEITTLEKSFNHLLDSLESCRRISKDERENNKFQ